MLTILTGIRQAGKTRLLEDMIRKAGDDGTRCVGTITPGIWERADGVFVKRGIDAVLLPQKEVMAFAVGRADSAADIATDALKSSSQSDMAKLGWKIFDQAIDRINDHFDFLSKKGLRERDLVVIDELGPLELTFGKGIASALRLMEEGPQGVFASKIDAIVVVRPELLDEAKKRFAPIWGEPLVIDVSK